MRPYQTYRQAAPYYAPTDYPQPTKGNPANMKCSALGSRIAGLTKKMTARVDALNVKLDDIDARADEAFTKQEEFVEGHARDIDAMEREIAGLTNGAPLEPSPSV